MPQINQERQLVADYESAKYITGALRDISAIELRRYRGKFERNTQLYEELQTLYGLISRIMESEGRGEQQSLIRDKLFVAYTTNKHFYGALNQNVMREFVKTTSKDDRCLIIGETGRELWSSQAKKRKEVKFLSFADDMPNEEETRDFLQSVAGYGQVFIFYPGFVSVFQQQVEMLDISFKQGIDLRGDTTDVPRYILEPEIVKMFGFFDTQVRYVLFERMLLETQLARVSARLMKMDSADENVTRLIAGEKRELRRAYASFSSVRLLEAFTGYLQWHKKAQTIDR